MHRYMPQANLSFTKAKFEQYDNLEKGKNSISEVKQKVAWLVAVQVIEFWGDDEYKKMDRLLE